LKYLLTSYEQVVSALSVLDIISNAISNTDPMSLFISIFAVFEISKKRNDRNFSNKITLIVG